jgi:tRNA dimethylallyltransferase
MSAFENALVLTGATACGKSALALKVAERIGAEIIALDSMTVYRGMDIGTAKPTAEDRRRVQHHLIDVLEPWDSLSVAWWLERAAEACREIAARGRRPLFVGGTPFYLKTLLYGLFPGPPGDPESRQKLEVEAERDGNNALHARLATVDPRTAARLHPNDVRRIVRALEVYLLTGRPISDCQQTWDTAAFAGSDAPPPVRMPAVVLELPRDVLYRRIDERVDRMLAAGWLEEVRGLLELPQPLSRESRQALGYRELIACLDGNGHTWEQTTELIRTHTRQFAKRQLTWFRHLPQLVPVQADTGDTLELTVRVFNGTSVKGEIDTPA